MKSIRDLYKVGKGPSSSHTMGPERAARIFKQENPGAERYEVTLYGSLALTGVGHGTDRVLSEVLAPTPTEIIFSKKDPGDLRHPNTLDFAAYKGEEKLASMRVESIGGGDIVIEGREAAEPDDVYPENSFAEIAQYCRWRYISLREYVELNEGPEIWDFLQTIWRTMRAEVEEAERRDVQNRHRQGAGDLGDQPGGDIRQNGKPQDVEGGRAVQTGGDDILFFQLVMHHAVNRTHDAGQDCQPDGKHRMRQMRSGKSNHNDRQQQRRNRQQRIQNVVKHRRAQAMRGSRKNTERQSTDCRRKRDHKCTTHRRSSAA